MNIRKNYNHTLNACYLGYITQAIVNNFAPLLFLNIFRVHMRFSLDKIALLVSFNFVVQLIVDLLAANMWTRSDTATVWWQHIFSEQLAWWDWQCFRPFFRMRMQDCFWQYFVMQLEAD
mgnify:CR=1 FL=1